MSACKSDEAAPNAIDSDTAWNFSWSHSYDTTDEELTSIVMESYQHSEPQHGLESFSTKETISPTS